MNTRLVTVSEEQLVSELWARDVRFLMGEQISQHPLLDSATLIQSLADSRDARVRMALIPLFLRHPDFFGDAKKADEALSSQPSQLYLRFYYTAAVLLQRKYRERLIRIFGEHIQLPDLFSRRLDVSLDSNPNDALVRLAERHQVLSGQRINWLETYEHGAERLVKYMEKFK
ncbi:MAG TPA: hypothetical protein PLR65_12050 [Anaerolineales bacterium]|nr:hypothetical protein [Anaerolineales bacterium]